MYNTYLICFKKIALPITLNNNAPVTLEFKTDVVVMA